MTAKNAAIVLIGFTLVVLTACEKDRQVDRGPSIDPQYAGEEQDAPKEDPGGEQKSDTPGDALPRVPAPRMEVVTEPSVPVEARVPNTLFAEGECDSREKAPDACTWSQAADAVVVGEIRDVRLAVDKVIGADGKGGWRWYEECKVANPALVIDLTVGNAMTGEVSKAVSVRVGWAQLQHFRPLPFAAKDGGLAWAAVRSEAVGPLTPGNRVVMGLHEVDGDWSLMGDIILGVDADDRIHVPRRPGDCLNTTPDELASKTINEAAALLSQCPATRAGSDRRKLYELHWGADQTPAFYSAGYCTDEVPELAVEPDGLPSFETEESGEPSEPPKRKR